MSVQRSGLALAAACYVLLVVLRAGAAESGCDEKCLVQKGLPVPTHRVEPRYPEALAERGIEGCVVVSFVITPQGLADKYQILDSQPKGVFDTFALKALNDWRFKVPGKLGRYAQKLEYRIAENADRACDRCELKQKPLNCIETPGYGALNGAKTR